VFSKSVAGAIVIVSSDNNAPGGTSSTNRSPAAFVTSSDPPSGPIIADTWATVSVTNVIGPVSTGASPLPDATATESSDPSADSLPADGDESDEHAVAAKAIARPNATQDARRVDRPGLGPRSSLHIRHPAMSLIRVRRARPACSDSRFYHSSLRDLRVHDGGPVHAPTGLPGPPRNAARAAESSEFRERNRLSVNAHAESPMHQGDVEVRQWDRQAPTVRSQPLVRNWNSTRTVPKTLRIHQPPAGASDGPQHDSEYHRNSTKPNNYTGIMQTGCGAAWLARLSGGQEVGSSNLPSPTDPAGVSRKRGAELDVDELDSLAGWSPGRLCLRLDSWCVDEPG
jgi:hypothetical protein